MPHDVLDGDAWLRAAGVCDVIENDCFSHDCGGSENLVVCVGGGESADVGVDEAKGGVESVRVDSDPWGADQVCHLALTHHEIKYHPFGN